MNEDYREVYDLVVGIRYGSEGVVPCHRTCETSCVGSSGENFCGNYLGCTSVRAEGTELFIVRCSGKVRCEE